MRAQTTAPVFIAVAVVAVAVLAAAAGLFPSGLGVTPQPSPTSTSVASVDGLALSLRISSAQVIYGGSVMINVSETNGNGFPLNESAARSWAVNGLRMGACYSSVYPFGVAVYQGHYARQNASRGVPLNLYPIVPCPLLLRYISGYYFQPSSDVALILPGSGQGIPMDSGVVARGNYSSGSVLAKFSPGEYTVVAGDEWGTLAFLYFSVS